MWRARRGGGLAAPRPNQVVGIAWIGSQGVGILVDAVSDILTVRAGQIRALPPNVSEVDDSTISGLVSTGDSMVALLDLDCLFPNAA